MQRLLAETTDWHTPALTGIVHNVARITRARPYDLRPLHRPGGAEDAAGAWHDDYRRWPGIVAAAAADPGLTDLVPPLAALATGETTLDKLTCSMFTGTGLAETLAARGTDAVASSSPAAHQATPGLVLPRLPDQIALADTATLARLWAEVV